MSQDTNGNKWINNEQNPPIFLNRGDTGVLLIHGFTFTEYPLRELGEYLAENNITALGVRLAGHGTSPDDLATTLYTDWINSAEEGLKRLRSEAKQIYIIGYSMGANIAFYLNHKYPDVIKGIVSMGAPIYIRKSKLIKIAVPIVKPFRKHVKKRAMRNASTDLKEYYEKSGTYQVIPISSVEQLFRFINFSKKYISKCDKPVLVFQSRYDPSVSYKSAEYVYNQVKTPFDKKEMFMIDESQHVPIYGLNRDKMVKKAVEFIKKHNNGMEKVNPN